MATVTMSPLVPHHAYGESFHWKGRFNQFEIADTVPDEPFRDQCDEVRLGDDVAGDEE